MARMIPATLSPETESRAEGRTFKVLRDSLNNSYTVFHSVDLLTGNLYAVYQRQDGRLVDIFEEIRIPLWRFIRGKDEEDYDNLECGDIVIEVRKNRTFFTLKERARNREVDEFVYYPTQKWKFLWENGNIQLIR